jgi:hypothetical protein
MPHEVRLWIVDGTEVPRDVPKSKLNLEDRLEKWILQDPNMLDSALLVCGSQVITDFGGRIDLLCLDPEGNVVIVELKRDKTPREIVAQALDYAAWAADLSHERIAEIAARHLSPKTLEQAFEQRFGTPLPDVLNADHKIVIVASSIDDSSERIIRYLSEKHGVSINAVTFQYHRVNDTHEVLSRVFLVEPGQVEYRAQTRTGGKRRPNMTIDEFQRIAEDRGVGKEFKTILSLLRPHFGSVRTTLSTVNLVGQWNAGKMGAVVNLLPEESGPAVGVKYQVYSDRLGAMLGIGPEEVKALLSPSAEPWSYDNRGDPEWEGFTGYMTPAQGERISVAFSKMSARIDSV